MDKKITLHCLKSNERIPLFDFIIPEESLRTPVVGQINSNEKMGLVKKSFLLFLDKNILYFKYKKKKEIKKLLKSTYKRENCIFLISRSVSSDKENPKVKCLITLTKQFKELGWKLYIIHHSKTKANIDELNTIELGHLSLPLFFKFTPEIFSNFLKETFNKAADLHYNYLFQINHIRHYLFAFLKVRGEYAKMLYLLLKYKPFILIDWHQWNSFTYLNTKLCEFFDIKHYFTHEGPIHNTLILDDIGEMGVSSICKLPEYFNNIPISQEEIKVSTQIINNIVKKSLDRKSQTTKGSVTKIINESKEKYKNIIFYCGVNDWKTGLLPTYWDDSNTHSPYFLNTSDVLNYLIPIAENENWLIIFKPHPNIILHDPVPSSKNLLVLHNSNTDECIENSDVVVTLVSSVAYSSLNKDIPVVLLGNIQLNTSNITYFPQTIHHIHESITHALNRENFPQKKQNYIEHMTRLMKHSLIPYEFNQSTIYQDHHRHCVNIIKQAKFGNWSPDLEKFFE